MIAYVQGTLKRIEEASVVVDVGGIGYRVFTPINEALLRIGVDHSIQLHTYMNVREDAMLLYGFLDTDSLDLFKLLINVNGIGPKNALGILATLSVDQIFFAIAQGDHKALTKVSGIGTKTAQRIILDLKDKVAKREPAQSDISLQEIASVPAATGNTLIADAILALEALGYSHAQASEAMRRVPNLETLSEAGNVQLLIREGLKQLAIL